MISAIELSDVLNAASLLAAAAAAVLAQKSSQKSDSLSRSIEPNHGSSVKDALARIEDQLKRQDHERGEDRRAADLYRDDANKRIHRLEQELLTRKHVKLQARRKRRC